MADLINFTLPNIDPKESDSKEMKFIKNYLNLLTEQIKFFLNNIDSDNYTEAYAQAVEDTVLQTRDAANQASATATKYESERLLVADAMKNATEMVVKQAHGGYIVFLDTDNDGEPDELRILTESPDYNVEQDYWVFNENGLAFYDSVNDTTTVAMTADGQITANVITTGELHGVGIEFDNGTIAKWEVETEEADNDRGFDAQIRQSYYDETHNVTYDIILKNDGSWHSDKKVLYANRYNGQTRSEANKTELFYIKRNGEAMFNGKLHLGSDIDFYNAEWNEVLYTSAFDHIDNDKTLRYKKCGNTVHLTGEFIATQELSISSVNDRYKICDLPSGYKPQYPVVQLCKGGGINKWLLTIETNGNCYLSRYSDGTGYKNVAANAQLAINAVFFND